MDLDDTAQAVVPLVDLKPGADAIAAIYMGDETLSPSTSTVMRQVLRSSTSLSRRS